jgi:hypothetical protein
MEFHSYARQYAREGGHGGGACHVALHRLLWNSRSSANGKLRGVHQSLHFAPACLVQHVAHNGISPAEFQRVMDEYLVWHNKRRPALVTRRLNAA